VRRARGKRNLASSWLADELHEGIIMNPQPTALAIVPACRAPTYVRHALVNPITISAAVLACCSGSAVGSALLGLLGVVGIAGAGVGLSFLPPMRRALQRYMALRAREARERARMERLRPAGPLRQAQYAELRELVEEIDRTDPAEARRFELQDLLDELIRLAVAHAGYQRVLSGVGSMPGELPVFGPKRSGRAGEILAKRIQHRDECKRRLEQLADLIEAIDQLIRLVAQRVSCPPIEDGVDHEIERRLWELEQVDTAFEQLSA
jgi:hypothetical protein